jgi:hypothetical protein
MPTICPPVSCPSDCAGLLEQVYKNCSNTLIQGGLFTLALSKESFTDDAAFSTAANWLSKIENGELFIFAISGEKPASEVTEATIYRGLTIPSSRRTHTYNLTIYNDVYKNMLNLAKCPTEYKAWLFDSEKNVYGGFQGINHFPNLNHVIPLSDKEYQTFPYVIKYDGNPACRSDFAKSWTAAQFESVTNPVNETIDVGI